MMPIVSDCSDPLPPKDKYQLLEEEYHRIRDELTQARATIEKYDRELGRRNQELREASQYIDNLQKKLDANTLSDVSSPHVFSTTSKTDRISISEVSEKVTALNEEIFQAAATLGEALIRKRCELSKTELDAAAAVSQEMVGEKMTDILITQSQKPEPEVNPLLVQVVLQIFMVNFCFSNIRYWYTGDSAIGEFLSAIYSGIYSTEGPAVSGRWRALTCAHTRPTAETWNNELYQKLQSVLKIASWTARSPENEELYENRLSSIFKANSELRIAIGEKFTPEDLDIFVFSCDMIFDPADMDDAYSDGKQSSDKRAPETIAGTTGIGLGKVVAEPSAKDVLTLIPAKTVLWSTLNEALEPVQPTRGKKRRKSVENTDGDDLDGRDWLQVGSCF